VTFPDTWSPFFSHLKMRESIKKSDRGKVSSMYTICVMKMS
jgi:hypothetical protein